MPVMESQTALEGAPSSVLKEWNQVSVVAAYLDLSEKALWQWIAARKIGVARFGRSVRISKVEVERVIREGTAPALRAS
jgi:excisionase family DNA binding protein